MPDIRPTVEPARFTPRAAACQVAAAVAPSPGVATGAGEDNPWPFGL